MPKKKKRANPKNQTIVDKIKDRSIAAYEKAQNSIEDAKYEVEDIIANKPFTSVVVAAGVGALVGAVVAIGINVLIEEKHKEKSVWSKLSSWF